MVINLNHNHLTVLEYVESKGDADLNEISYDLYHDIPKHLMRDILNFVVAKELLIKVDEEHPGTVYKLSDNGIRHLSSLRQNAYRQQQRQNLEVENLRLQNEAMQYNVTLRRREAEIRHLTTNNLHLQNKSLRRTVLFFVLGALVTFIASNWQWILQFFQHMFHK